MALPRSRTGGRWGGPPYQDAKLYARQPCFEAIVHLRPASRSRANWGQSRKPALTLCFAALLTDVVCAKRFTEPLAARSPRFSIAPCTEHPPRVGSSDKA